MSLQHRKTLIIGTAETISILRANQSSQAHQTSHDRARIFIQLTSLNHRKRK